MPANLSTPSFGADSQQRVLLVDDDAEFRRDVADVLRLEGWDVREAAHGAEALAYLRGGLEPQLILLDIEMPVMTGWDFCEVRRTDETLSTIPVVILSGTAGASRENPYAGVAAVLGKPFTVDALFDVIRRFGFRQRTGSRPRSG